MAVGAKNLHDLLQQCLRAGRRCILVAELLSYMEVAAEAIDFLNEPAPDLGAGPVARAHCAIQTQSLLIVGDSVQVCDFGVAWGLGWRRKGG